MARELTYTIAALPPVWPGKQTPSWQRKRAPFKSQWSKTTQMLARELEYLGAKKVEIACEVRGAYDIRQDGQLRADARPGAAVILSFLDRDSQRQAYPCDTFAWWQDNLYAIAIVLEDLRRAERYGVQSALIRAGFKALPQPGQTTTTLSTDSAASVIASFSQHAAAAIRSDAGIAQLAVRQALARTHPDKNAGDQKYFLEVSESKRVLEAHHGGSL